MSEELEQEGTPEVMTEQMKALIAGEEIPESVQDTEGVTESVQPTEDPMEPEVAYVEPFDPENPTDTQKKAMDMGWNPEVVPDKDVVSAQSYIDRKPIFDRAHKAEKAAKEALDAVKHMQEMQEARIEKEREKAREEYKAQMKEAVATGDEDAALKLAEDIADLDKPAPAPEPEQQFAPEFTAFLERNPWYDVASDEYDPERAAFANEYGNAAAPLVQQGKMTLEQVYAKAEKLVQEKFKPQNNKRNTAVPTAPSAPVTKPTGGKKTLNDLGLDSDGIRQARTVMRMSNMSEEAYVEQYLKAFG